MRIALAKLLLEKPNLLLLDEPTNHLDLEARNWLEQYLANYPFAYVLISHDRYFLDVTVNKIVEIWNRGVHFYSGNYEKYLQQKQERTEQLEAAYRNQRERIEQLEAFINRFRYQATKAKQVQSRIKELDKIERIELPNEEKTIHFSFPQPKPSGRIVAEFQNVSKSYGDKFVFGGVNFIIERGDRIALVGVNGAGKSTLIKLLAGSEPLIGGEYRLGHNAEVDYFAQDQYKELDPNARMLDDLQGEAPRSTNTELRSLLGCFLFSEDDVFKRIGVLSGGERNRYALARMLLQPSNFLLLDEPTNHLDMRAKDVLLESLEKYTGTVVFVSHDRYFIDKLATRIFEVGNGEVNVFPGNYEDYIWRKEGKQMDLTLPTNGHGAANPQPPVPNPEPPAKRVNPLKLKKQQDRAKELEPQIAALEAEIASHEEELANFVSAEETMRVSTLLEKRRTALERSPGRMGRGVGEKHERLSGAARASAPPHRQDRQKVHASHDKTANRQTPTLNPGPGRLAARRRSDNGARRPLRNREALRTPSPPRQHRHRGSGRASRTICWIPSRTARSAAFRLRNGASSIPKPPAWREAPAPTRFWSAWAASLRKVFASASSSCAISAKRPAS